MDAFKIHLVRVLAGDLASPQTYTDAQIRSAITIGARPALPHALRLAGTLVAIRYGFL